jgi:ABC-type Na+ efflux pump permease subunit
MKVAKWIGVCIVGLLAIAALSGNVSAYTATVPSFDTWVVSVQGAPNFDLTYEWTSDQPLTFAISGPGGILVTELSSTSESGSVNLEDLGTYYLTWTNLGAQDADLNYTYTLDPFQAAEDWLDRMLLIMVIVVVVVIAIIVLVVVVVVRAASKKAPPQGPVYAPQQVYGPPAAQTGVCPMCGTPVDPSFQFCAKCGARTR